MAVKIYDSSVGAFKDAPTPQIYDVGAQAYKDSTGLVYDTTKVAWDERWSADMEGVLYNKGNECKKLTGGWDSRMFISDYGSSAYGDISEKREKSLYIRSGGGKSIGFFTHKAIDLTGYSKICVNFTDICKSHNGTCIDLTINPDKQILCDKRYIFYGSNLRITDTGITTWNISRYVKSTNNNFYFGFGCWGYADIYIEIDKIWLEK